MSSSLEERDDGPPDPIADLTVTPNGASSARGDLFSYPLKKAGPPTLGDDEGSDAEGSDDGFGPDVGGATDAETGSNGAPAYTGFKLSERTSSGPDGFDPAASSDPFLDHESPSPGASASTPDDSPSVEDSVLSSPGSSAGPRTPSFAGRLTSATPSPRPFDRRFQSRLSVLSLGSSRPSSPAFLRAHSRQSSISSAPARPEDDVEPVSEPWEVVRWTKLRKLSGQALSEAAKRNFGRVTALGVAAVIVMATSKGILLVFDFNQSLKAIVGPGTKAVEAGPVTALAISADHTTVAAGHASGAIFTWDLAKPARPFLHIPALARASPADRHLDGHVPDAAVVHLAFLGARHTALVSADDRGMAFSHLATRGLGAAGRTVKTHRILGRYPADPSAVDRPRKPSTVLAFASLPLSNVAQATDDLGLVAMLTPYLLVIVSTTPVAQTQYKTARPKDLVAHGPLSGCLAWFPAVKLKTVEPAAGPAASTAKLVYCWSNILTVLDVEEGSADDKAASEAPPELSFVSRSRWRGEESIVAVQWLGRSVLALLTITQQLIIIEEAGSGLLRMTDSFDLIQKHIFHQDLFSSQLQALVEPVGPEAEDPSMHGVVADAFYASFRAYKGRIFLLGVDDLSVGALSRWADRLTALMEADRWVSAIELATSYYNGEGDILTVGLPDDERSRHPVVAERLTGIMSAALASAFAPDADADDRQRRQQLADACLVACLSTGDRSFLFDDIFDAFDEAAAGGVFLEALEPYVLDGSVDALPPVVVKGLINHFISLGLDGRLEEMICRLDANSMDIDQVTTLCRQHHLYDAFIYVWNRAIGEYITPLIELLSLVTDLGRGPGLAEPRSEADSAQRGSAEKMFPYLSFTLTGRVYPTGAEMDAAEASRAKAEIYAFLFSGKSIERPRASGRTLRSWRDGEAEPTFPYLRLMLGFDAPSFLGVLNEAFEDAFLNGASERMVNGGSRQNLADDQIFGLAVTRQYIVSILSEVMNPADFPAETTIYLDMFIARNLPKFPQFILLSGTALHKVIVGLCRYPNDEVADDCQLSVEYLLSTYRPADVESLIPLFAQARFFRVLKSVYRADRQFPMLLRTFFEDGESPEAVFDCIGDCLRPQMGLSARQVGEVKTVIQEHARELCAIDTSRTAEVLESCAPDLHSHMISSLDDDRHGQFVYLRTILEPSAKLGGESGPAAAGKQGFVELYIRLMCEFDASHVADYTELLQSGDLRLEEVLPAMEESGVVDAAVVLMARDGRVREAMERLTGHLNTLEAALLGLLDGAGESPDPSSTEEAAKDLMQALDKYTRVGLWLCQGQTRARQAASTPSRRWSRGPQAMLQELSSDEALWLELVDCIVHVAMSVSSRQPSGSSPSPDGPSPTAVGSPSIVSGLRSLVQQTFTALLTSTTGAGAGVPTRKTGKAQTSSTASANLSFLRILRAFLSRASIASPSLSELRAVLTSIFSAYAYQESLLGLANHLLEKALFVHVAEVTELRQRGWRPQGQVCEICGKRVWGPGAGAKVWEAWRLRQARERETASRRREARLRGARQRGKSRAVEVESEDSSVELARPNGKGSASAAGVAPQTGPLVVFACRHIFHRSCLARLRATQAESGRLSIRPGGATDEDGQQDLPSGDLRCVICR